MCEENEGVVTIMFLHLFSYNLYMQPHSSSFHFGNNENVRYAQMGTAIQEN